ncbi:hypothetical protein ABZ729_26850 [Streptomyces sp. NPDC006678]|uniref:hypothetical protein n=1 Tax=Streptomyces sp. NPDC006678 TaxID=3157185 RepID=UPI003403EC3F
MFDGGRLAVRWFEPEVGPEMHQLLTEQTRLVWKALRAATRPAALQDTRGRRITGPRIGAAAHDLAAARRLPLTRGSIQRLYLMTEPPNSPVNP